ncbi:MAG: hypothetical protein EXR92_07535 [Gemmatimonadetes bacterium]|nr:hypothetical protein [Gemmatimonadota bacterium]
MTTGGGPHLYRGAAAVLGSLALLFVGFLVVGFLLPSGWDAERSVRITAVPDSVFPHLSHAERWGEWTPSPATGVELFGPSDGPGSGRRWDDPLYGKGEFVIAASTPPRAVSYEVQVDEGAIQIRGELRLEPEGDGTMVRWREEGDFGWNPLLGYLARRMNELQGAQMEASLLALKQLTEGPGLTP